MDIKIAGLHLMSDDAVAKLRGIASDEGHTIVAAAETGIADLWEDVKAKFPETVKVIEAGIADVENSSLSGGDKAVKVATDVLPYMPAIINELADAKSFAMHAVTTEFARLKNAGKVVLADIAAKL